MTGLAHISRFSHETARRIIERPDLHGTEHLRAACVWLTIHGDWLDVNRAAALMRALDRGEAPGPLPPRGADMEGAVSERHRVAAISVVAGERARRLASARLKCDRDLLEGRMKESDRLGRALIACMALIAISAAVALALTIGGRP